MISDLDYTIIAFSILVLAFAMPISIIIFILQKRGLLQLQRAKRSAEITAMENERLRVAADLHDEITPVLSAIKLSLSSITKRAENNNGIGIAIQRIDELIMQFRKIENILMPQLLLRYGVVSAVEQFIVNIGQQAQTQVEFSCQDIPDLPQETSINLYRIILEIIHNTWKHSKASTLSIKLQTMDQNLILSTFDNGVGFDVRKTRRTSHGLGLLNLHTRAEIMNGDMDIDSKPGCGTKYTIKIPLK